VYIPKRLVLRVFNIDDDDWIVARDEHPIGFGVPIVALLIEGGLAICFGVGWFLYGQPFTDVA
jgi:hypothetical protein